MEALLFTLDVFFMALLVWSVLRIERKKGVEENLGFFAFREAADAGKSQAGRVNKDA